MVFKLYQYSVIYPNAKYDIIIINVVEKSVKCMNARLTSKLTFANIKPCSY